MRWLLIFLLLVPAAAAQEISLTGFVNDYADILTPQEEEQLAAPLKALYDSGEAEFVIVTVRSLDGRDIESFSLEIAQGNLGSTETNNGLLLLVAIEDRQYRFEVGRGIEPVLNDAKVGRIGRTFLRPNFKRGDYFAGLYGAAESVKSIVIGDQTSEYYVDEPSIAVTFNPIWIFFLLMIIFSIIGSFTRRGRRNSDDLFWAGMIGASMMRGPRGGFGGGGFGGFGGGGFGGGGAGGGW